MDGGSAFKYRITILTAASVSATARASGLLFAITAALARTYHAREEGLVREWFAQADKDLSGSNPFLPGLSDKEQDRHG
jgi:hypothetical protein